MKFLPVLMNDEVREGDENLVVPENPQSRNDPRFFVNRLHRETKDLIRMTAHRELLYSSITLNLKSC